MTLPFAMLTRILLSCISLDRRIVDFILYSQCFGGAAGRVAYADARWERSAKMRQVCARANTCTDMCRPADACRRARRVYGWAGLHSRVCTGPDHVQGAQGLENR